MKKYPFDLKKYIDWLNQNNQKIELIPIMQNFEKIVIFLNELQKKKMCHRDIKPENFFVEFENNQTKIILADFGIVDKIDEKKWIDKAGTVPYMSPEYVVFCNSN